LKDFLSNSRPNIYSPTPENSQVLFQLCIAPDLLNSKDPTSVYQIEWEQKWTKIKKGKYAYCF